MAPYLTPSAAMDRDRRLIDLDTDLIAARIEEFEGHAERYRGVAYTPRSATATIPGTSRHRLVLPHPMVSAITSVSIDGAALSSEQRAALTLWGDQGMIERPEGWPATQIVVVYVHGLPSPPPTILDACTEYVNSIVRTKASGVSRNTLSEVTDAGTTRYSTPDWAAGRPTGWLEVDRLLNSMPDHRTPGIG